MRYLKTLLVALLAFVSTASYAVTGATWAGNEVSAGTFYLYNVGTGTWFCPGNNWGTHASTGEYGIDLTLAQVSDGVYTIDTQISNSIDKNNPANIGGSHFLNGEWCDGSSMNWTFTQVAVDGAIAYNIANSSGQLLTADAGSTNVYVNAGNAAYSQWILVSKDDVAQAALDATTDQTVDVTPFIIGQRTGRNNVRAYIRGDRQFYSNNNVWKSETDNDGRWCNFAMNGRGGTDGGATPYAVEAWNWKSFNFYQDITDIPNGKYTVHVNSFYRAYGDAVGVVYGNSSSKALVKETQSVKDDIGTYATGSDLRNAAAAFFDGKYDNEVDVVVTDGSLRVGVKQENAPGGDWMPFANFRLEYKGMTPVLEAFVEKANALIPELDETNAAMLLNAVNDAMAVLEAAKAGTATNSNVQDAIEALDDVYKTANALNIAKQLAANVLNDVPAALFPEKFKWNLRDDEKWEDINGKEQMEINRQYKVYKNNAGRYKLASRLGVAMLIDFLQLADATDPETIQLIWDDMDEQDMQAWILSYFGHFDEDFNFQYDQNKFFDKFAQAYTGTLAEMLTKMARFVVESHGEGIALYEQNDPNYSRMYDALTGNTSGYPNYYFAYWIARYGDIKIDRWNYDIEPTLSDTYELLHEWVGSGNNYYNLGNHYFGFDPTFTAHITNPKFEDGLNGWTEEVQTVSWGHGVKPDGECMTNCAGENDYPYYDINNWGNETDGFKANVYQQIQLPAGRYMLTISGRCSAPNIGDNDGNGIPDYLDGAFTTPTAANNSKYFQVYAINSNGIETAQSLMPQIGNADELEGNYWSNVHAVPGWNNYSVFGNGWNDVSVFFTMPSVGSATVGFKVETPVGLRNWASATNFRLTRLGDVALYFDENQTYDTELNWDPVNFFFKTAPTDVVLHKNLKAGKWQSIALPVDLTAEQIEAAFGKNTELAIPSYCFPYDEENKQLIVDFESWDVTSSKNGLVQTKLYGYGLNNYWNYNIGDFDTYYYDFPAGMIANVPYLIKPTKVNASNLYVFHDVQSSETHGSKVIGPVDGIWSWGGFHLRTVDQPGYEDYNLFTLYTQDPELEAEKCLVFAPNYKFDPNVSEDYTVEFSDFTKAFSAKFESTNGWNVIAAFMDGGAEIITDQVADMLEIGKSRVDWYPGIPAAITKAMTKDPKIEGETGIAGFGKDYNDGTVSYDHKTWTSKDGRISLVAESEDALIYYYDDVNEHFMHEQIVDDYLSFRPGTYTLKANNPYEYIYGYNFYDVYNYGETTWTLSTGEEVKLDYNGNYGTGVEVGEYPIYDEDGYPGVSSVTFTVDETCGGNFEFTLLYGKEYTNLSTDELLLAIETLQDVKSALVEAKKAYEPSKKFHALVAEAEELLNSDHDQLVENADALFKRTLQAYKTRFDLLTNAEAIVALNELLAKAVEDYKTQIAPKIEVGDVIIYNVGAKKYFGAGNSWGTRSSLTEHGEYFTLARLENGAYTLESRYSNGGEKHFVGTNYFVDGDPMELTIAPTSEEGVFTIACTGEAGFGYLGWDGTESTEIKVLEDKASKNAQWRITSVADMTAQLAEATVEAPKDATFLVKDANFSRNNRDVEAWDQQHGEGGNFRVGATSSSAGADQFNCSAEAWLVTFDVSQEVALPNGVYTVQAQAAITDYNNVGEGFPEVYAGEESTPFIVMEEGDQGSTMLQLQKAFAAGNYWTAPIVVEVTDGTLKIGARSDQNIFWAIWDNFVLTYYGDVDVNAVKDLFKVDGSDVTGINNINGADGQQTIYNVNGVRMNNAAQKGVYIINGKKVVK